MNGSTDRESEAHPSSLHIRLACKLCDAAMRHAHRGVEGGLGRLDGNCNALTLRFEPIEICPTEAEPLPTVASKVDLVAPALMAMATPCMISGASGPTMCTPSTCKHGTLSNGLCMRVAISIVDESLNSIDQRMPLLLLVLQLVFARPYHRHQHQMLERSITARYHQ